MVTGIWFFYKSV